MNRSQIESAYKIAGINDFELRTTEDLLKTHGVDHQSVEGFNELDDLSKKVYERFILNFFNSLGLESRATLVPISIYWVIDRKYLVEEDGRFKVGGINIKYIDSKGKATKYKTWIHKDYRQHKLMLGEPETYLRFEYKHRGKKEWLHVLDGGTQWR